MALTNLERLEERITKLTERFAELKQSHEKALRELSVRDQRIDELNDKMKEFQKTRAQVSAKIESVLKRLELLKTQSGP